MAELQRVIEEAPTYAQFVTVFRRGPRTLRARTDAAAACLGFLLVSEKHQRQGICRRAFQLLEEFARGWRTCDRICVVVIWTDEGIIPFWERLSFDPTGEIKPYRHGSVASESVLFEKRVDRRLPNPWLERTGG